MDDMVICDKLLLHQQPERQISCSPYTDHRKRVAIALPAALIVVVKLGTRNSQIPAHTTQMESSANASSPPLPLHMDGEGKPLGDPILKHLKSLTRESMPASRETSPIGGSLPAIANNGVNTAQSSLVLDNPEKVVGSVQAVADSQSDANAGGTGTGIDWQALAALAGKLDAEGPGNNHETGHQHDASLDDEDTLDREPPVTSDEAQSLTWWRKNSLVDSASSPVQDVIYNRKGSQASISSLAPIPSLSRPLHRGNAIRRSPSQDALHSSPTEDHRPSVSESAASVDSSHLSDRKLSDALSADVDVERDASFPQNQPEQGGQMSESAAEQSFDPNIIPALIPTANGHDTSGATGLPAAGERTADPLGNQDDDDDDDVPLSFRAVSSASQPSPSDHNATAAQTVDDDDDDRPLSQHFLSDKASSHFSAYTPSSDFRSNHDGTSLHFRTTPNTEFFGAEGDDDDVPLSQRRAASAVDDDDDLPLSQHLMMSDQASSHFSAQNSLRPRSPYTGDGDDDDLPLSYHASFTDSPFSQQVLSDQSSGVFQTPFSENHPQSIRSFDSHVMSHVEAVLEARLRPLIQHIQNLDAQVHHLTTQLSHLQDMTKHYGPARELGPGRFLQQTHDPAQALSMKVSHALQGVSGLHTNPVAAPKTTVLGKGLVANMPVRVNFVSDEHSQRDPKLISHYDLTTERLPCRKCEGKGYQHTSSTKHKASALHRCKKCTDCPDCGGSGMLYDKNLCEICDARGFLHTSQEAGHPGLLTRRCANCSTCHNCYGHGVIDLPPILAAEAASQDVMAKRRSVAADISRRQSIDIQNLMENAPASPAGHSHSSAQGSKAASRRTSGLTVGPSGSGIPGAPMETILSVTSALAPQPLSPAEQNSSSFADDVQKESKETSSSSPPQESSSSSPSGDSIIHNPLCQVEPEEPTHNETPQASSDDF
ncbi:hypothetical protein DFS34DRAFT_596687 [Phlyctochytrium arcticum]|nr:hypothetical protein DFS34DRAFT_596687 [Phlyctochytrium arcticum]